MWVKFDQPDTRRIKPKAGGITTTVIKYKPGMVENVPKVYGQRLVREGKAQETVSPNATDKA